jgi:membrane-bound serine protease (ClpP class)
VGSSGELPPTLSEKATNDASALMRGIAAQRGRNAQWLEDAVRLSVAATAQEARELGVIDIVSTSQADLLAQIDGRTVATNQGPVVLQTHDVEVRVFQMNWPERFLRVLVNPNLAFVLLALGALGILVEFVAPGHVAPGVVGALLLLLGFLALGSLPVNWIGVALLALGIALLVVEAFTPGFGAFGLVGIAAFVIGAFFMFTPFTPVAPSLPQGGFRISRWLIGIVSVTVFAVFSFYLSAVIRARRARPLLATTMAAGTAGVATSDLTPRGTVQAASELWTAEAVGNEPVRQGEGVEVVGVEGLVLKVRKARQLENKAGGGQ